MKKTILAALLFSAFGLSVANDYDIGRDSNTRSGTLREGTVREGIVIQVRNVKIEPTRVAQRTSRTIGAVVGAGVGSQASKKTSGKIAGGVLGGLLGGVAGDKVGDVVTSSTAQEIIIKHKDTNKVTTLTQAQSNLREGQTVYLVQSAGKIRVIEQYVEENKR